LFAAAAAARDEVRGAAQLSRRLLECRFVSRAENEEKLL